MLAGHKPRGPEGVESHGKPAAVPGGGGRHWMTEESCGEGEGGDAPPSIRSAEPPLREVSLHRWSQSPQVAPAKHEVYV